jgi:hypothetical protein
MNPGRPDSYLLYIGAALISDGSEFLVLIPELSHVVGSIILPVLA